MRNNIRNKKYLIILAVILASIGFSIYNSNFTYLSNEINSYNPDLPHLRSAVNYWDEARPKAVGTNPVCVFIGDANNDGYEDIVTANWGSSSISILMWNTYYNDWDPEIIKSVGLNPRSVYIGDANNDNYNDIVNVNTGDNNVSILLWNSTSVDWDPQITRSVGDTPRSVFVGDADNDNYNDIITADEVDGTVSILRWNTLTSNWDTRITRLVGSHPLSVFVGDANNDGYKDIVTANNDHNNISILRWNETNSNWNPQITKAVGDGPNSVYIGDANNDGYKDIITANTVSDTISILLWNVTYDNWDDQVSKSVGDYPMSVFVGDANNDGENDIISTNLFDDNINVLLWNETYSNWDPQITRLVGDSPNSVYIGDANNDNLNDIVVSNMGDNDVSILLGIQKLIYVEIVDQSFSKEEFNITFYVFNESNFGIDFATIDMWWNAINVSSSVQNLGNGLYFISLEPITVSTGEDPILLNMTITSSTYNEKYYETEIAVEPYSEPISLPELLYIESIDQSYSTEKFNITISVYNATGHGIDSATIQMEWNGTDVSDDVQNLGDGVYFISLDPITVEPGDDPILLTMTISALGYLEKDFELALAVDPEILDKVPGLAGGEIPLTTIFIVIVSIVGSGVGISVVLVWYFKKKRVNASG